jgi:hypothetical protein
MVVHAYDVAGGKFKDHAEYFRYIMNNFNIVFIIGDNAGTVTFIQFLNEYENTSHFKIKVIQEADFNKTDGYDDELKKARNAYNKQDGKIAYLQPFSSDWIRRANESLQANVNHRRITFASDISGDEEEFNKSLDVSIPNLKELKIFSDYELDEGMTDESSKMTDLVERQGELIDRIIHQTSLIEVKTDEKGMQKFVLPGNLKSQTGASKQRKDLYSALLLNNWGQKCYLDMIKVTSDEGFSYFVPRIIKS